MRTYTGTFPQLLPHQIFVFGSNTQGRHGKGAAKTAIDYYGARYGQAEGRQGQSYAIVTKDLTKDVHPSRTVKQICQQIDQLYAYAEKHLHLEFYVVYSAMANNLNSYTPRQMAEMFAMAYNIPANMVFEIGFSELIVQALEKNITF